MWLSCSYIRKCAMAKTHIRTVTPRCGNVSILKYFFLSGVVLVLPSFKETQEKKKEKMS